MAGHDMVIMGAQTALPPRFIGVRPRSSAATEVQDWGLRIEDLVNFYRVFFS
jgi:hypothetical protein